MNKKILFGVLRAPEGEGNGGGNGELSESHEAAADKLFGGGDDTAAASSNDDTAAKPSGDSDAAGQGKHSATAGGTEVKPGLLGKLGKKPAGGENKPGEGTSELPEDKISLGEKAAPETKKHFETMKGLTKQLRSDLAAKEVRIKELESAGSNAALPADYEKLKAEHKAFSDRIAVLDLRSHPDFARQFTEPKAKIVGALNTVLSDNQVEGSDLTALLGRPRAEFMKSASEIAEKLPDYERFEFLAGARQLYQLSQAEQQALGQSAELAKGLQAKTLEAQRAAFGKTWQKLGGMGEVLVKLEADADATPEQKTAVDAYNKALDAVRTNAEALAFSPGNEEVAAQTAVKAATFDFFVNHAIPRMEAEYKGLVDLVGKLQSEVVELRGGKGEAVDGGGGDGGHGGDALELSLDAAAAKVWGR